MIKVVFFGNERLATGVTTSAPALKGLIQSSKFDVRSVITNYTASRSRKVRELEIQNICASNNIPLLLPEKPRLVLDQIKQIGAHVGVLVAYGKIVPQEVINVFPAGIVNIHPSLLPKHRGPTPIESAILGGDKKTGVSLMKLEARMDAGPVYKQAEIPLSATETKQELADKLSNLGASTLIDNLEQIISGELKPSEQNDDAATYDSLIKKSDGIIDWTLPAEQIDRQIRAYSVWPGSKANIFGIEVIITAASADNKQLCRKPGEPHTLDSRLFVCCQKGSLEITMLKPVGKKEMTAKEFISGHYKD